MGVLRWQGQLDFLLERLLNKPVERLDLAVALALRMGLYQLRFLQRIPARAAVNESVEMVKRARKASAATLVNAVLRKAAAESATPVEAFVPPGLPLAERSRDLRLSHPQWMVDRWLARFGESRTGIASCCKPITARQALSIRAARAAGAAARRSLAGTQSQPDFSVDRGWSTAAAEAFSVYAGAKAAVSPVRAHFAKAASLFKTKLRRRIPLSCSTFTAGRPRAE